MRLSLPRLSVTGIAAAVGAGMAAVLLSMITLQRPPLTIAMGFVSPLPVMIAALGFGWASGTLALLVGILLIAAVDLKMGALTMSTHLGTAALDSALFFVGLGVPALVLAWLTSRPFGHLVRIGGFREMMRPEERRLGSITLAAALFAVIAVGIVFAIAIFSNGGFEAFNVTMVKAFEKVWQSVGESRPLPAGLDVHKFAVQLTWALAPLMAASLVVFYVFNLWLAARTAQTSGLLTTAWTDIPGFLRLPRIAAVLFAVALGLSFLSGVAGFVARIVSAALIAAFALQGLAVAHALTRGRSFRLPLLIIVYLSLAMLFPWPLAFWGFFGLLDTALSFRDRHRPPDRPGSDRSNNDRPRREKSGPWGQAN